VNQPENDELVYMSNEFGSYWGRDGQVGYGLTIYDKPGTTDYVPDKWYHFN